MKLMNELPKEERPYEKCLEYGPQALSDSELLAVIIRTGTKGENAVELARRILSFSKSTEGILSLLHLTIAELKRIKGVGTVKAVQLKCIAELSRRIAKAGVNRGGRFQNPAVIAEYYMEDMRHRKREILKLMMFDSKNHLLHEMTMTSGTVNASIVSPREIFIEALRYEAVSIALIHNHPSGDPEPSREDILSTMRVKQAGELTAIPLIDHIIIGDNRYISMKERGLL